MAAKKKGACQVPDSKPAFDEEESAAIAHLFEVKRTVSRTPEAQRARELGARLQFYAARLDGDGLTPSERKRLVDILDRVESAALGNLRTDGLALIVEFVADIEHEAAQRNGLLERGRAFVAATRTSQMLARWSRRHERARRLKPESLEPIVDALTVTQPGRPGKQRAIDALARMLGYAPPPRGVVERALRNLRHRE